MKHTFLLFLATALAVSLQATSGQAIDLKLPSVCISPKCCEAPQCCEEPQCCETEACKPKCTKPICPCCHKSSCMVVCEMKKVKKTVWVVEYEKFAPVNPSCNLLDVICDKVISCTKSDCGEAGCCEPEACSEETGCDNACGHGCCDKKYVTPECGRVRCKKKLIKKEITCEVPVYKCVVTGCKATCSDCGEAGCGESAPAVTPEAQPEATPAPTPEKEKEEAPVARLRVPVFERY